MRRRPRRRPLIIAMDGPAGVGKSTVGQLVAKSLGYQFVNTGEMYRALTWKSLERGIDPADAEAVAALAKTLKWTFLPTEEGRLRTFVDGENVAGHIRDERVSRHASSVAANPAVRRTLCGLQRRLGRLGGIVMEGRDIATHVFPDADVKIYLDASIEERADRRYRQLTAAGHVVDRQKIKEAILLRDLGDLKRKINPLSIDPDAWVIDSTRLTMHQVSRRILAIIRRQGPGSKPSRRRTMNGRS